MISSIRTLVLLRTQQIVRDLNTSRAFEDPEFELSDITELDWVLARGDRAVSKAASTLDYDKGCFGRSSTGAKQYNQRVAEKIADDTYREARSKSQLPCLSRFIRSKERNRGDS